MQLTLYLDNETEALAKAAAAANAMSVSRWVAQTIQEKTLTHWPKAVRDAAGAFPDWPLAQNAGVDDIPRETLD